MLPTPLRPCSLLAIWCALIAAPHLSLSLFLSLSLSPLSLSHSLFCHISYRLLVRYLCAQFHPSILCRVCFLFSFLPLSLPVLCACFCLRFLSCFCCLCFNADATHTRLFACSLSSARVRQRIVYRCSRRLAARDSDDDRRRCAARPSKLNGACYARYDVTVFHDGSVHVRSFGAHLHALEVCDARIPDSVKAFVISLARVGVPNARILRECRQRCAPAGVSLVCPQLLPSS